MQIPQLGQNLFRDIFEYTIVFLVESLSAFACNLTYAGMLFAVTQYNLTSTRVYRHCDQVTNITLLMQHKFHAIAKKLSVSFEPLNILVQSLIITSLESRCHHHLFLSPFERGAYFNPVCPRS
jgi:hypothetical protein